MLLKIGELAKRTGLTVRTLHHYDAIKLLRPSVRSEAGYRLYNRADIERLHRIQALRRMDLSLADIASLLEGDGSDLQTVIAQQIVLLDRQARRTLALRDRLQRLHAELAGKEEPELSDWLVTLEMMVMYDKYFTPDELVTLRQLTSRLNKSLSAQSTALVAEIRDLMDRKVPPESSEAQALAAPWMALMNERMGGDMRLIRKLDAMHRNEPAVQVLTGVDGAMIDYMSTAFMEYRFARYAKYLSAEEMSGMRSKFASYRKHWMDLAADTREQMERDPDPFSAPAQALFARWVAVSREVWGPERATQDKVRLAHASEPDILIGTGVTPEMVAFLAQGIPYLIEQQAKQTGHIHEQ